MVGDGIRNVTLRTTKPLNDNEWHYVEAEINVKMARLKVDFYPPAIHKFPGQTYISMQFTQPLLVGAKASFIQKEGEYGCRSLRMEGFSVE